MVHEILDVCCDVEVNQSDEPRGKPDIMRKIKGKDGLLCILTDAIDPETINSEPKLKIISSLSVGYNHIDVVAVTKNGIMSHTPPMNSLKPLRTSRGHSFWRSQEDSLKEMAMSDKADGELPGRQPCCLGVKCTEELSALSD